jgi:hypothetical protein
LFQSIFTKGDYDAPVISGRHIRRAYDLRRGRFHLHESKGDEIQSERRGDLSAGSLGGIASVVPIASAGPDSVLRLTPQTRGTNYPSPRYRLAIDYWEVEMKKTIAATILVFAAGGSFAQTNTPAVATSTTQSPAAPVAGANSFTEGQAKSRIEAAGYTDVSGLMKDKDGIWHGKGSKAGKMATVSLDYQGNITAN